MKNAKNIRGSLLVLVLIMLVGISGIAITIHLTAKASTTKAAIGAKGQTIANNARNAAQFALNNLKMTGNGASAPPPSCNTAASCKASPQVDGKIAFAWKKGTLQSVSGVASPNLVNDGQALAFWQTYAYLVPGTTTDYVLVTENATPLLNCSMSSSYSITGYSNVNGVVATYPLTHNWTGGSSDLTCGTLDVSSGSNTNLLSQYAYWWNNNTNTTTRATGGVKTVVNSIQIGAPETAANSTKRWIDKDGSCCCNAYCRWVSYGDSGPVNARYIRVSGTNTALNIAEIHAFAADNLSTNIAAGKSVTGSSYLNSNAYTLTNNTFYTGSYTGYRSMAGGNSDATAQASCEADIYCYAFARLSAGGTIYFYNDFLDAAQANAYVYKKNPPFPFSSITDGNLGDFGHTGTESIPWIQIDLGADTSIGQVIIYNRVDCCQDRLNGARVALINNAGTTVYTSAALANSLSHYTISLPNVSVYECITSTTTKSASGQSGRYVAWYLNTGVPHYQDTSEIQVFANNDETYNIAYGKTAIQSSTYLNDAGYGPSHLTDGAYTSPGGEPNYYIAHTGNDASTWQQIDLGANYNVTKITAINRWSGNPRVIGSQLALCTAANGTGCVYRSAAITAAKVSYDYDLTVDGTFIPTAGASYNSCNTYGAHTTVSSAGTFIIPSTYSSS
jgi:hypothetical protein